MTSLPSQTFTSFDGWKRIAHGDLKTNAVAVKRALDALVGAGKAETNGSGGYRAAESANLPTASEDKTLH